MSEFRDGAAAAIEQPLELCTYVHSGYLSLDSLLDYLKEHSLDKELQDAVQASLHETQNMGYLHKATRAIWAIIAVLREVESE